MREPRQQEVAAADEAILRLRQQSGKNRENELEGGDYSG
jgi:hypothetical protein